MPFRDEASRWRDILECIMLIEEFVAGLNFAAYAADDKTRSAVERQILILSEAAKNLGAAAEVQCPDHDWKGFRGMGDILRHAYHRVDDQLVWNTVTLELAPLKACVERVLASPAQQGD